MAVRPTLQLGDPLLRTPCRKVGDTSGVDIRQLAEDLSDTLADWVARAGYGRGIAAPQIGEPVSFSVEFFCKVRRFTSVDVAYESLDGSQRRLQAGGELGELLQHEIDHLDGVLAVDRMTSIDTLCMRSEFERRHRSESPYRQ